MFSWENLDNAKVAYDKLIAKIAALGPDDGEVDREALNTSTSKFSEALNNDLNTSMAVTCVYDALKLKTNAATKRAVLDSFDQVLGLDLLKKADEKRERDAQQARTASAAGGYTVQGEGDPAIDELVLKRAEAKRAKNFAEADRIRDELKAQGIEVTDVPGGAVWKRV